MSKGREEAFFFCTFAANSRASQTELQRPGGGKTPEKGSENTERTTDKSCGEKSGGIRKKAGRPPEERDLRSGLGQKRKKKGKRERGEKVCDDAITPSQLR